MIDLIVILQNKPGTMAKVGETLGKAGISIESLCGFPCAGEGIFHIMVVDGQAARQALEAAGFEIRAEREVLVHTLEEKAGSFGALMRKMANAGINVDLVYAKPLSTDLIFGVDDLDKARSLLD